MTHFPKMMVTSAADARFTPVKEIKVKDLIRWLKKSRDIQWDDKDIVKRKGVLQRLK
jgi:hypothetical protein